VVTVVSTYGSILSKRFTADNTTVEQAHVYP